MTDDAATDGVPLEWTTRREGGVVLVELTVENPADERRRVRVESRVPTLPPREGGVPEAGWDGDAVELAVGPGERRGVGYAATESVDPPADLAWSSPVEDEPGFDPVADVPDLDPTPAGVVRALGSPAPPREAVPDGVATAAADPSAWLDAVERRVERAEALSGSVPEATEALSATDDAASLPGRLADDAEALRRFAARATDLADRAEAADPPVVALRRLS